MDRRVHVTIYSLHSHGLTHYQKTRKLNK
ncbi:MAG: hypothetical protein PWP64_1461, partial [Candidatus Cloacimonadota bacterium]|nr:hypothetical protein [Candidatus Cloacimonadota bacterium]